MTNKTEKQVKKEYFLKCKVQKKKIKPYAKGLKNSLRTYNGVPDIDTEEMMKNVLKVKVKKSLAEFNYIFNEYTLILLDEIKKKSFQFLVKKNKYAQNTLNILLKKLDDFIDTRSQIDPLFYEEAAIDTSVDSILDYYKTIYKEIPILEKKFDDLAKELDENESSPLEFELKRLDYELTNHENLVKRIKKVLDDRIMWEYLKKRKVSLESIGLIDKDNTQDLVDEVDEIEKVEAGYDDNNIESNTSYKDRINRRKNKDVNNQKLNNVNNNTYSVDEDVKKRIAQSHNGDLNV